MSEIPSAKNETIKDKIFKIKIETIVVIVLFVVMVVSNLTSEKFTAIARLDAVEKCCIDAGGSIEDEENDLQKHKEESSELFGAINQNLETLQDQSDRILNHLLDK